MHMYLCVCEGGDRGPEEVSDYLPPPLAFMLPPGFISSLHLQIKFVLRMDEWSGVGEGVYRGRVCLLCSIREAWAPSDNDKPDVIRVRAGAR